ncbi:hypothetical protein [Nitrosomonas communis]|uniref:hypothetical protein n=1 Tax=Nitrosomonas communis TaxID=44574 RepID=UPI0011152181|nr:hypothetical protein [Nitrosomonas communis]
MIQPGLALGGRQCGNLSRKEEVAFLALFIEKASAGGSPPKQTCSLRVSGKKLRDILIEIDREWQAEGILRLMFQDEARFRRVSDTCRCWCWCPQPIRPLARPWSTGNMSMLMLLSLSLVVNWIRLSCLRLIATASSYFQMKYRHVIPMTGLSRRSMGQDGIVVTPSSFHIIYAY